MSACCVSGCKNRHSSKSKLKFYRIPSWSRPFQANRRRLWLQAIEQVNGGAEELKENARICSAHFISGEASMDHDSPDFVPSVFTCSKQSASTKEKVKWFRGCRKRRCRADNAQTEVKATPPRVDSPVDLQSSVLMEETQTQSTSSLPKEGETEEAETETKTFKSQTTSSPNKTSPLVLEGIRKLDKGLPTVLLKSVVSPAGRYQCDLCNQNFTNASEIVKHKRLHEEEEEEEEERSLICETCGKLFTSEAALTEHQRGHDSSFACNICDRSFTTSHNLKRHKLLHVKDGRKCGKCGVLFCQRHNHILFTPQTKSEEESVLIEPQNIGSNLMPGNSLLEEPEPSQTADLDDDAQSTLTITHLSTTTGQIVMLATPSPEPLSKTHRAPLPASRARISSEIPVPLFRKPSSMPCPPPQAHRYSKKRVSSSQPKPPRPSYPTAFVQPPPPQHLDLPPSLQLFSPRYLTSALLEVKRNYEYILSKPRGIKNKKVVVKEEPCELPLVSPGEQSIKKESTAYDLEVGL